MNSYRPTHTSREDGSMAMISNHDERTNLCIVTNENGDQFPDYIHSWAPLSEAVVGEREQNVSDYECERWRAMSDELRGQTERLKHLAQGGTRAEWQAIECIERASSNLFGAFGAIMMERHRGDQEQA